MTKRMEMLSDDVLHSEALDAIDAALDVLRVPEQPSGIRGQHDNQPSLSRLPPYADITTTMSLAASFASLMASDGVPPDLITTPWPGSCRTRRRARHCASQPRRRRHRTHQLLRKWREESSDEQIQMRERGCRAAGMDALRVRVEEKIKVITYFCIWIYN
jgi:hypothetical protein